MKEVTEELDRQEVVRDKQGLVIVYTGHGKGKTTAALGVLLRAWGWERRACVVQFIKSEKGRWGEKLAAERLGIEWHSLGTGRVRPASVGPGTAAKAQEAWALAQERIASGELDMVILDEMTYALNYHWLDVREVLEWLKEHRPPGTHVVITGRDAPPELVAFADLVTEMHKVKHPFDRGIKAQRGIEF